MLAALAPDADVPRCDRVWIRLRSEYAAVVAQPVRSADGGTDGLRVRDPA